jgi:hypothetical protein
MGPIKTAYSAELSAAQYVHLFIYSRPNLGSISPAERMETYRVQKRNLWAHSLVLATMRV